MTANEGPLLLQEEAARVVLDPQIGGAVREFTWHGTHILRPAPAHSSDPFAMACFPMVPFVNRIAAGRFRFQDRTVQLARNWSDEPHPLHGQGWRASWRVANRASAGATLHFEGGGDEWPWRYRAEQHVRLTPHELSIGLSVENLSEAAMPAMLGLHPYFPEPAAARLRARLPRVWMTDEAALPVQEAPTPAQWSFDPARSVSTVALDHCFCGWDGGATLQWPRRTVRLRAEGCTYLQIFTPPDRDFFCIEPQTAAPGALGRESAEASFLAPGARMKIDMHLRVAAR